MKKLLTLLTAVVMVCGLAVSAHATLIDRGGGLIYDDVLNITWLQDANLAATQNFGVSGISSSGSMDWDTANDWIGAMNTASYLGYTDWRLLHTLPVGTSYDYNFSYDGSTDYGYNISAPGSADPGSTGSEMAYMYYVNLGNLGYYDTSGTGPQVGWGLTNTGPFGSSLQPYYYWSGTEYDSDNAWNFNFNNGNQDWNNKDNNKYAWAVRPGE